MEINSFTYWIPSYRVTDNNASHSRSPLDSSRGNEFSTRFRDPLNRFSHSLANRMHLHLHFSSLLLAAAADACSLSPSMPNNLNSTHLRQHVRRYAHARQPASQPDFECVWSWFFVQQIRFFHDRHQLLRSSLLFCSFGRACSAHAHSICYFRHFIPSRVPAASASQLPPRWTLTVVSQSLYRITFGRGAALHTLHTSNLPMQLLFWLLLSYWTNVGGRVSCRGLTPVQMGTTEGCLHVDCRPR